MSTSIPLVLRPNPTPLETGRASYSGVVQQLPRSGGVRECFVARPGHVLCSCDYGGLELATHAQSCLWLVGWSKLADALNGGIKVHDALGASMVGKEYESFVADVKAGDKYCKNARQAAKAGNFGFPGGMAALKLTLNQRQQGPDTFCADGFRYKGLRFCVLIGGADRCGKQKVTEYKNKPIPPTCLACIECAEELRTRWFQRWPENKPYFSIVSDAVEKGQSGLLPGQIRQHISKRIRGGVEFCAAANGFFQGLAADGAKRALTRVAREQYCRIDGKLSPLYGSRTILFAHDEIIAEMPEASAHEAAARLSEIMVASMREFTPDVTVEAPPCLMRAWHKAAEPVFSSGGRLIPWEPHA